MSGKLVDVLRATNTVDDAPVGTISGGRDYSGLERSDVHVDEVNRATLRTTTNVLTILLDLDPFPFCHSGANPQPKLTVAYEEEKLSGVGIYFRRATWKHHVFVLFVSVQVLVEKREWQAEEAVREEKVGGRVGTFWSRITTHETQSWAVTSPLPFCCSSFRTINLRSDPRASFYLCSCVPPPPILA
eukprot:scaffold3003_cov104-Skeletonema_dohrnii-CCMP3373.AAC.1